jgi:phosphatidylglycerophosphatase C
MHSKKKIAIFDFDKTVVIKDSFIPFLIYCAQKTNSQIRLLYNLILFGTLFFTKIISREKAKSKFISSVLSDCSKDIVKKICKDFCYSYRDKDFYKDAIKLINWHKTQGHQVILASASPSIYVNFFADRLGFHSVLATNILFDKVKSEFYIPKGSNLLGKQKLNSIISHYGNNFINIWAYSDSLNDFPLLSWANNGFAINPSYNFKKKIKNSPIKILIFK